ncbi:T9SS type A sorting domain-containing protein [Flavobacteriales bacterium]|nr:T9SS type A sorting domain-containing protein [Flavobacteriales bacterium]
MKNFTLNLISLSIGTFLSLNASGQYCVAGPSSTIDSNVESALLTGETTSINYTGCPGIAGVEDQTTLSADLKTGYVYTASIYYGTCGNNYAGGGEAWIDFNGDGVFDASESIGSSAGTPGTAPWDAPIDFTFTVPVTATLGTTGMRVMQQEGSGGSPPLNPCGTFTWGSVVDFTIDISYGTTCAGVTGLVSNYIGLDTVNVGWTAGSEIGWNFELGNDGFVPGTGTSVYSSNPAGPAEGVSGLTMGMDYDVYVQADCGVDSSQWVGPLDLRTLLTCPSPSGLSGIVLSSDSLSLSWTPGDSSETEWMIQYGSTGFTLGSGTSMLVSGAPTDTISGLSGGGIYDIYVQGICGAADSSFWIGPVTFATPASNNDACDAILLPVDGSVAIFSNLGATSTGPTTNTPNNNVWFQFIAPASGAVAISNCETLMDTELEVFSDPGDCADYSAFVSIGYADGNPWGCSVPTYFASGIEMCGLTPGATYYFWVGPWSTFTTPYGDFPVQLYDLMAEAGNGQTISFCEMDTVSLWTGLSGSESDLGTWVYPTNPLAVFGDSLLDASYMTLGGTEAYYILSSSCGADTAIVSLDVQTMGATGTAIDPFDKCNDGPVSLWDGLMGTVNVGGTWNDDTGTGMLSGSDFLATGLPDGTYQFTYAINNGICPASATTVTVNLSTCIGINEHPSVDFTVYPNPNRGKFVIRNNGQTGDYVIQIRDLGGRLVYNKENKISGFDLLEVNLEVETGVYFLVIKSQQGSSSYKMIIE